ncbi:hypothetical protein SAMN04487820_10972 [Actinopolyspora mzabensis]|uniref:Uncharacterized protein n=1 Tax=Actinopolyspora mzabensis TaxID=995066 RepID=A0A1G9CT10_ACTMZ|nr:hypothetical protein SAMN04487820_10972 [Actinopolyspora mzabensis]
MFWIKVSFVLSEVGKLASENEKDSQVEKNHGLRSALLIADGQKVKPGQQRQDVLDDQAHEWLALRERG